jgi:hypothetical protein
MYMLGIYRTLHPISFVNAESALAPSSTIYGGLCNTETEKPHSCYYTSDLYPDLSFLGAVIFVGARFPVVFSLSNLAFRRR